MLSRHVDFFMVAVITFGLLAFSKISAQDWVDKEGSLHLRNALEIQDCPESDHVVSSVIADFLDQ